MRRCLLCHQQAFITISKPPQPVFKPAITQISIHPVLNLPLLRRRALDITHTTNQNSPISKSKPNEPSPCVAAAPLPRCPTVDPKQEFQAAPHVPKPPPQSHLCRALKPCSFSASYLCPLPSSRRRSIHDTDAVSSSTNWKLP
jgi:hypothetical protein